MKLMKGNFPVMACIVPLPFYLHLPTFAQHYIMSTSLPPQSTPNSGISISRGALWLVVLLLLAAIPFSALLSVHKKTYRCLREDLESTTLLFKNLVPVIKEKEAGQNLQGHNESASESTKVSLALAQYVSFYLPNHLTLTCSGAASCSHSAPRWCSLAIFPGERLRFVRRCLQLMRPRKICIVLRLSVFLHNLIDTSNVNL